MKLKMCAITYMFKIPTDFSGNFTGGRDTS